MFDANLRLLPNGLGFVGYAENLSNQSPLFKAGLRAQKLFIGRKPLKQPEPQTAYEHLIAIEIWLNGQWITTTAEKDILHEWLVFEKSIGPQNRESVADDV